MQSARRSRLRGDPRDKKEKANLDRHQGVEAQ